MFLRSYSFIDKNCIIIFDELVNYPGFDGMRELIYEFITETKVDYEWKTKWYMWLSSRKCGIDY